MTLRVEGDAGLARWLSTQTDSLATMVETAAGRRVRVAIDAGGIERTEAAGNERLEVV